jgi:ParB/RepB/Spo0J family partition protein
MTSTTTTSAGELRLALDDISVRENVRELDSAHVENLAQSIALRGVLVPLIVWPVDGGYELVAGYHRIAACRLLDLPDVPVVVRDHEGSSADSAAENVTRKQLTPLEEAKAVQAMLDEGYTADGAAQALGWSRQLVTARAKILKLPAVGQQLVGMGEIPVSAIDNLLAIGEVSEPIVQAVVEAIRDAAGRRVAAAQQRRLGDWPGAARCEGDVRRIPQPAAPRRRQGAAAGQEGRGRDRRGRAAAQAARSLRLRAAGDPVHRGRRRPGARGRRADRDRARRADHHRPRSVPRVVQAGRGPHAAGRQGARRREGQGQERRHGQERTPREELDTEHRATLREITRQAHGTNLDLGAALLTQLASVEADDIDVARFFAYGLLGPDASPYASNDDVAKTIAANGLRLVLEEHGTTTTPTLKSGARGKTKVAYCEPDVAAKWLWRFIDGAKSAGELYGRALVVFAAQHYASQLVLPTSKRRSSILPRSHKDTARKAFERVTKGVLPASHTQLQRAIAAEARSYERSVAQLDTRGRARPRRARHRTPASVTSTRTCRRTSTLRISTTSSTRRTAATDRERCRAARA